MKKSFKYAIAIFTLLVAYSASASEAFDDLENFQKNTPLMVSSGLPTETHFKALSEAGVSRVVDLIPGDRENEKALMTRLGLDYQNIPVDWHNPTLANFKDYVVFMNASHDAQEVTLTHCKLNWRGAVFTYLYRVTQLGENEEQARQDMLAIWHPDETWQGFIGTVKGYYEANKG